MPETPTHEPLSAIAGDTIKFKRSWSDYPTASWTLSYTLHSRTSDTSTATAAVTEDDNEYIVTFSASDTASLTPGDYSLHGRITGGSELFTVYHGLLRIRQDVASAAAGDDLRSFASKALATLETALISNLGAEFVTFSVDGQSFTRVPRDEAVKMRDKFKTEVLREQQAERLRQGIGTSRHIYTRFA